MKHEYICRIKSTEGPNKKSFFFFFKYSVEVNNNNITTTTTTTNNQNQPNMGVWQQISSTFWSTSVWLPPNTTWDDIAPGSRPDVDHADYRDLWWPLPMAVALLIIRISVEK